MSNLLSFLRSPNTGRSGQPFSAAVKIAVWQKARIVPGLDPAEWRMDACGTRIKWSAFGTTADGGFGWEIDHILPVAHGGTDDLGNLQALQWQNNRHKSDSLNMNYCLVQFRTAAV